jgi:hypothetical protein
VICLKCNFDNPPQAQFCAQCGLNFGETERGFRQNARNPTVALLLSMFLPAIGQVYNGDVKKAAAMWGGYLLSAVLAAFYIGILIWMGVWVWSMIDAHSVASGKTKPW